MEKSKQTLFILDPIAPRLVPRLCFCLQPLEHRLNLPPCRRRSPTGNRALLATQEECNRCFSGTLPICVIQKALNIRVAPKTTFQVIHLRRLRRIGVVASFGRCPSLFEHDDSILQVSDITAELVNGVRKLLDRRKEYFVHLSLTIGQRFLQLVDGVLKLI